jgi:predicted dehydrogenase
VSRPPASIETSIRAPRLGFLGTGWIGRKRLESVASAACAEITAVADPIAENRAAVSAAVPQARLCETLEDLLSQELDAIVIATPSALHAEQAIAALERGLAVFCQKPLGRTAAEVESIISAARKADRLLGIDLSYRHCRGLQVIRDLIRQGELGRIFAANFVFHNAYGPDKPWFYDRQFSGGGCVIDLGIHLVDLALWMLPGAVTHVSSDVFARGNVLEQPPVSVEDFASARLRMEGGAIADITCSWRVHAGRPAVIEAAFFGTNGGASWRNVDGSFIDFRAERYRGTETDLLTEPPEDWGGGAIVAWARQLALNPRFDPAVEEHQAVAGILDAIYRGGLAV